jgi:hypothetical protein
MLTFEQKVAVIESFPELQRKDVSLGRVNYHYEDSMYDKKNVVYHLHPKGNGYVYAGLLKGYDTDDKGFVNIRDIAEDELRELLQASIRSLSPKSKAEQAVAGEAAEQETWTGPNQAKLLLVFEDDMWYVYSGLNLDMAFEAYDEAVEYLQEEGFVRG